MKPLFAHFLPAIVSEQPPSAAEDARACRALTGLHLLTIAVEEEEKQAQDDERRETFVESNAYSQRIAASRVVSKAKKGLGLTK